MTSHLTGRFPAKAFTQPGWQTQITNRLARAEQSTQVVVARDMIRRIRELSRATKDLYDKIAALVGEVAPQLLAEPGIGVLLAAKFIGEIAGIDRFTTDAQLARLAGCAPIPVSSGRSDRHRLDPGGNRRLNSAFYMLAIIRIRVDPRTAVYLARQRANGKTQKEAIRNLKRQPRPPRLHPHERPKQRHNHDLLDIGGSRIPSALALLLLKESQRANAGAATLRPGSATCSSD